MKQLIRFPVMPAAARRDWAPGAVYDGEQLL
jgi:hypothetical protein